MTHVEPPADGPFTDADPGGQPADEGLRIELQHVLGLGPDAVDDWLAEHGAAAGEQRVVAYWA